MNNTINNLSGIVSPPIAGPAAKAPDALGKEDFLRLLIAQIQKQDPLNPQDPTEFTAQLTQFSSLEQLISVNNGLDALGTLNVANMRLAATSAIGRRATVSGESLTVAGGVASPVNFDVARDATAVKIHIRDGAGNVVNSLDLGPHAGGQHNVTWNGLNAQGNPVLDGTYTFSVEATDAAGDAIPVESRFTGIVTGVTFENGQTLLKIGAGAYSMNDIIALEAAA